MQFFKFELSIKNVCLTSNEQSREFMQQKANEFSAKTYDFNTKQHGEQFFFVSRLYKSKLTGGIISSQSDNLKLKDDLESFIKTLDIDYEGLFLKETTLRLVIDLIAISDRNDFIDDDEEVLENFNLDKLTRRYGRSIDYSEHLLDLAEKKKIYSQAEKFLMRDSLFPELDRIYRGKKIGSVPGHPVHYIVQTDDAGVYRESRKLLLEALYANKRIHNKRYCSIDFWGDDSFSKGMYASYEQLYKSNFGGAIIVRYNGTDRDEDNYADSGREVIKDICKVMKKYRNDVLTIICLPRECTKIKDIFFENLGTISIIELKEELASIDCAKELLKTMAKEQHIRTDKQLFEGLEEGKGYLVPELRGIFDGWYNKKLKTGVYPQYKSVVTIKQEIAVAAPKGSAYDELQEMIGLSDAKRVIKQAVDYHKAQKLFADKGMQHDHPAMHMVFTGAPGTAKTSVARLFARIMKENGLLSKGRLIEVGRSDLVGKYVGWTAPAIKEKFKEAEGSVLFIDEAYSLVDDRGGSYGDEAINTIVQEMENRRDSVVVIFAGYTDKMEEFLQRNPGLRSRIAFNVPFADYNADELCGIAGLIAKKKGLVIEEAARERMCEIFEIARKQEDFGNGRYARNVIEKARMAQSSRLLKKDYDSITGEDIITLRAEDIEMPAVKMPKEMPFKRTIGFSA